MSVDGTWDITIESPMGAQRAVLELTRDGDAVGGTGRAMGNTMAVTDGAVDDGRVTFAMRVTRPVPMRLRFDLEVAGDEATGHVVAGPFGKQPVTGRRTS